MLGRRSIALLLGLALLSVSCNPADTTNIPSTQHTSQPEKKQLDLPSDLHFNTSIIGPRDFESGPFAHEFAQVPDYNFTLIRDPNTGNLAALMKNTTAHPPTTHHATSIPEPGGTGPSGIKSCQLQTNDSATLLFSRDITLDQLCTLLGQDKDTTVTPLQSWETMITMPHGPLHGMGAIPMPVRGTVKVTSYTSKDPESVRSIAIAQYPAPPEAIDIFDWWFGSWENSPIIDSAHQYITPAIFQVGYDTPPPDAIFTVKMVNKQVLIVRCADLSKDEQVKVLKSLNWDT